MNIPNPFDSQYPFGETLSLIHFIILLILGILYLHHTLFFVLSIFIKNKNSKKQQIFINMPS